MNIKQLKKLIEDMPNEALVYQETGDHELYEPQIVESETILDEDYGLVENYKVNGGGTPALIIR